MKAGGMLPGRDPPVRGGAVHESECTRVTRLFLAERTVIRKDPLGPDAEHRLRHEVAILERLRGVAGVAQLAEAPRHPGSIVLEDTGGTSLASSRTPLAAADLIGLAIGLAQAVAGMHRRGVIHRDITPANIVRRRSPRCARSSRITPKSLGRWRIWRLSRPAGPGDRWISGRICTRWARRCMSWRRARRRSDPRPTAADPYPPPPDGGRYRDMRTHYRIPLTFPGR